jgi:hypothetical protein
VNCVIKGAQPTVSDTKKLAKTELTLVGFGASDAKEIPQNNKSGTHKKRYTSPSFIRVNVISFPLVD